jgi:UDPglucose 6-dehydrogenase
MKISIMGIDYDELLSGKALAEMGNEVTYVSHDNKRIENIKRGYYNADEAMIIKSLNPDYSIDFTANIKAALSNSNMCFISEGITGDSSEKLENILQVAKDIGANMTSHMFIVDRSSLEVSVRDKIKETIEEELTKRNVKLTFELISNPNFLKA